MGWGAYVIVSYEGAGAETVTPAEAAHTRFLQSGQAMFVQTKNPATGAATLTFKETQKNPTHVNNIFCTASGKPGMSVYPNPVTNGIINLQMNNMPQEIFKIRIFNSLGQTILTRQINHTQGTENIKLGKVVTRGEYQIEVKSDNSKFSQKLIAY